MRPHDKTIEDGRFRRAFSIMLGIFKLLLIVYYCSNNVAECTVIRSRSLSTIH